MPRDPKTPAEWQEAVDAARCCLALHASRQYGLVTGGPGINVYRCELLLAEGLSLGYSPAPDAVERWIAGLDQGRQP